MVADTDSAFFQTTMTKTDSFEHYEYMESPQQEVPWELTQKTIFSAEHSVDF